MYLHAPYRNGDLAARFDADAMAWIAAVNAGGGTVSGGQGALVGALIGALKGGGVWSSLDRLWIFAAENATQALIDLKARSTATAVNSPTFTANRGYAGNGTTAYIDTNFNASTAGGNYVQNDAMMGVWVETAQSGATRKQYIGNDFGAFWSIIGHQNATIIEYGLQSTNQATFAFSTETGLWLAQRTASNAQALFKDGASVATAANVSNTVPNANFFVLASNTTGTPGGQTDGRASSAHIGKSLTAGQNTAFYNAMRAYMTAVGVA